MNTVTMHTASRVRKALPKSKALTNNTDLSKLGGAASYGAASYGAGAASYGAGGASYGAGGAYQGKSHE